MGYSMVYNIEMGLKMINIYNIFKKEMRKGFVGIIKTPKD